MDAWTFDLRGGRGRCTRLQEIGKGVCSLHGRDLFDRRFRHLACLLLRLCCHHGFDTVDRRQVGIHGDRRRTGGTCEFWLWVRSMGLQWFCMRRRVTGFGLLMELGDFFIELLKLDLLVGEEEPVMGLELLRFSFVAAHCFATNLEF